MNTIVWDIKVFDNGNWFSTGLKPSHTLTKISHKKVAVTLQNLSHPTDQIKAQNFFYENLIHVNTHNIEYVFQTHYQDAILGNVTRYICLTSVAS